MKSTRPTRGESPEPNRRDRPVSPGVAVLVLAPVVWLVALPAVHAGIPWALSHLGPRYGWADGGPTGWNLLGYVLIAVARPSSSGSWCSGSPATGNCPSACRLTGVRPPTTGGPYAISRHPMYIGELALWLGLAVLFGSPVVLAGFAFWVAVMRRLAVREEAGLEAAFGDRYRRYKARVPRGHRAAPACGDRGRTRRLQQTGAAGRIFVPHRFLSGPGC